MLAVSVLDFRICQPCIYLLHMQIMVHVGPEKNTVEEFLKRLPDLHALLSCLGFCLGRILYTL